MRIDCESALPEATRALRGLEDVVRDSRIEPRLLELIRLRASQLNNCASCIDLHAKEARRLGEDDRRLYLLSAWREAPLYDARERTALEWCEALTLLPERGAPHQAYFSLRAEFGEQEVVALTLAIAAINAWNRFAVGFRWPVGEGVSRSEHRVPHAAHGTAPAAGHERRGGLWDA